MSDQLPGVRELENWLLQVSGSDWLWHVKYLSANDTYAKANVHQGGPHVGKALLQAAFPQLSKRAGLVENPDLTIPTSVDSHAEARELRLIWYNSRRLTGQSNGRDEARLTRWGGRDAAIVEPDATGSLVVMAFHYIPERDADAIRIWRCRSEEEEDYLLGLVDGVAPGRGILISPTGLALPEPGPGPCALRDEELPEEWRRAFPTGEEIVQWVVANRPQRGE